jgi:hypothetical protein
MKNFLNEHQIERLQAKKWNVVPDGGYINLYPEDFDNYSVWEAICDQLDISYETKSIEILYFAKKVKES